METREFAERILFGETLEDKLFNPGRLTDEHPGAPIAVPAYPTRPAELSLSETGRLARPRFPKVHELEQIDKRGEVLHCFANHELLALELMALTILKFPDAPADFRRGLVGTMYEEQNHTRMYCERLSECGIAFGSHPISDFFWRCTAHTDSPLAFVAQMCLVFEQANLDYSGYYADAFTRVSDPQTATIMMQVFDDEIGHVRYGWKWFNHWRNPREDEFTSFQRLLTQPLTPSRAKGLGDFSRAGRQAAGLTERFINQVEVFSQARTRPPTLFWFNPACEDEVAAATRGDAFAEKTKAARLIAYDLSLLPLYLASGEDAVLVENIPSLAFLKTLREAGIALPECIRWQAGDDLPVELHQRKLNHLSPWGWSPQTAQQLSSFQAICTDHSRDHSQRMPPAVLYQKSWSAAWLRHYLTNNAALTEWLIPAKECGVGCASLAEITRQIEAWYATNGATEFVVKADCATAGRGQMRVRGGEPMSAKAAQVITTLLAQYGTVVVEPWLERVFDFSFNCTITPDGKAVRQHLGRFLTDARGQYRGAVLGRMPQGLPSEVIRFLTGDGHDPKRLSTLFAQLADTLARDVHAAGYVGPLGVDAFVYRTKPKRAARDLYRLKPVVEINPRWTMGRIAEALGRRVAGGFSALWLILSRSDARAAGCESLRDFARLLAERAPLLLGDTSAQRIRGGILLTTEPTAAQHFLTILVAGKNEPNCLCQLPAPLAEQVRGWLPTTPSA